MSIMLERLRGQYNYDRVMAAVAEIGATEDDVERVMLKLAQFMTEAMGGRPAYTGATRVYSNGTRAYEVRCPGCDGLFWVVMPPYAMCPDCDPDPERHWEFGRDVPVHDDISPNPLPRWENAVRALEDAPA